MRAFFAVLPPEPVLAEVAEFVAPRQPAGPDWRWGGAEQWHLTLAFMAELPQWRQPDLVAEVERWAGRQQPVQVRLQGGGAFPNPAAAKVLWLGVDQPAATVLADWSGQLRAAASHNGVEVDGRRFVAHVTVARSGRAQHAGRLVQALDTFTSSPFEVGAVELIGSELGRGRPRYTVLERFPFTPRAPGSQATGARRG